MELLSEFLKQIDKTDSNFHPNNYPEYPHLIPTKHLMLSSHEQNPPWKCSNDHNYIIRGYIGRS